MAKASLHQAHDKFFKRSIKVQGVAKELIEQSLPERYLKHLDLTTLKPADTGLVSNLLKQHHVDVLLEVRFKQKPAYLLCQLEHQSQIDHDMALRLLQYRLVIWQNHLSLYPDQPLPVILPVVVYVGNKPWDAPRTLAQFFGDQADLLAETLLAPYGLIDVGELSDEKLREYPLAGLVEYTLKHRHTRALSPFIDKLLAWLQSEAVNTLPLSNLVLKYILANLQTQEDYHLFEHKVEQYLQEPLRTLSMTLAKQYEQVGLEKGLQQGIRLGEEQGRQQGMQQERYQIAETMLKQGYSLDTIANLTHLDKATLQKLSDKINGTPNTQH